MTLLEIVVIVAFLALITVVTIGLFSGIANHYSLETERDAVQSFVERAREKTISSDSQFGVRFATSSIELFEGSTYAGGTVIQTHTIPNRVSITEINLAGGGVDVVFERLVGTTSASGTIVIAETTNTTSSSTIHIYGTGISEIE